MNYFDQINEDLKQAMRAKDKVSLQVLRTIKKHFLEAKTAPGANNELTEEKALQIILKLVKQGNDSATIYKEQNREDLYTEEMEQVAILEKYLPTQLSEEELKVKIKAIIDQLGASTMKDMGQVMGAATQELAGQADGKSISNVVRSLLA